MDPALLMTAAGMKAQMESLDLLANNIANAGTTGYKADQEFYRLFLGVEAEAGFGASDLPWMPVIEGSVINYQQGPLITTGGVLDVALAGPGFLSVEGEGGVLYTRNGGFTRSATGRLQTSDGLAALDGQGRPIDLPAAGAIEISRDGVISVDGLPLAQLGVVEFDGSPPLVKAGRNYFQAPPNVEPRRASETEVRQGSLEASNVNVPEAAVRLILASRNFEMMRRAASLIGDEMNGRAVEELGRIR